MKVRCIDVYGRTTKPNGPTLLNYQQLRERNSFQRYYLEAVPKLVASVLYFILWDSVPSSVKRR